MMHLGRLVYGQALSQYRLDLIIASPKGEAISACAQG